MEDVYQNHTQCVITKVTNYFDFTRAAWRRGHTASWLSTWTSLENSSVTYTSSKESHVTSRDWRTGALDERSSCSKNAISRFRQHSKSIRIALFALLWESSISSRRKILFFIDRNDARQIIVKRCLRWSTDSTSTSSKSEVSKVQRDDVWTITTTLTKTDITPSVECRTTLLDLSRFVRIIKNFGEITLKLEIKLSETLTWDRGRPRVRLLRTLLRYEWSSSLKTCTWRDDVSRRFEFWAFAIDVSNGWLNTSCSTTIDNETSYLRRTWSRRRIRYQIGYEKEVCVISPLWFVYDIWCSLCQHETICLCFGTSAYNVLIWGIDLSSRDWKIITTSLRRDIIEQGRLRAIQFWSIHFGQSIFVCCVVVGVDRCCCAC